MGVGKDREGDAEYRFSFMLVELVVGCGVWLLEIGGSVLLKFYGWGFMAKVIVIEEIEGFESIEDVEDGGRVEEGRNWAILNNDPKDVDNNIIN